MAKRTKRWSDKSRMNYERAPGHEDTHVWLTPPRFFQAFGRFDLDPCAAVGQPWPTAKRHYTIHDDDLVQPWKGRVWCNPPYGKETKKWVEKMIEHGNGLLLIYARVETQAFFRLWETADAVMFFPGRLSFYEIDGTVDHKGKPAANAVIAYGKDNVKALHACGFGGVILEKITVVKGDRITKL